jgi:hypothetical protein
MTEQPGPAHGHAATPQPAAADRPLHTPAPGRPVVLTPTPPGLWLIIGGAFVAALGPLFGFLVGTMMGTDTEIGGLSPIYLLLFLGILVGGLGIAAIMLGVRTMMRHRNTSDS